MIADADTTHIEGCLWTRSGSATRVARESLELTSRRAHTPEEKWSRKPNWSIESTPHASWTANAHSGESARVDLASGFSTFSTGKLRWVDNDSPTGRRPVSDLSEVDSELTIRHGATSIVTLLLRIRDRRGHYLSPLPIAGTIGCTVEVELSIRSVQTVPRIGRVRRCGYVSTGDEWPAAHPSPT